MTKPIVPKSAKGESHPGLIFKTAKRQITQAKTIAEVKDIRDKAIAMAVYALQAKNIELKAEMHHQDGYGLTEDGKPAQPHQRVEPYVPGSMACRGQTKHAANVATVEN